MFFLLLVIFFVFNGMILIANLQYMKKNFVYL